MICCFFSVKMNSTCKKNIYYVGYTFTTGQNLALDFDSWEDAIMHWFDVETAVAKYYTDGYTGAYADLTIPFDLV